jgi:hypothetical protein
MSTLTPISSSTPGLVNLKVYRAQDNRRELSGASFVLTDRYTDFQCDVRAKPNQSSRLLVRKTEADGIIKQSGKVYITWTASDFDNIEAGVYWFDLFAIKENGFRIALIRGKFEVEGNITIFEDE